MCFQCSKTTQTQEKELIPSLGMTIDGEKVYLFTAGTESCLKQQHLSNLTELVITVTLPVTAVPFLPWPPLTIPTAPGAY